MSISAHIGHKIRALRKERHWTLEHLANYLNMSPQNLCQIECGKRKIYIRLLYRVGKLCGEDMRYFFDFLPVNSEVAQ